MTHVGSTGRLFVVELSELEDLYTMLGGKLPHRDIALHLKLFFFPYDKADPDTGYYACVELDNDAIALMAFHDHEWLTSHVSSSIWKG